MRDRNAPLSAGDIATLAWDKMDGLLPAVVQDRRSGRLLMLGYMNLDALAATLETGLVTFFSRSKQRLWRKGESSGHVLRLVSVHEDCDRRRAAGDRRSGRADLPPRHRKLLRRRAGRARLARRAVGHRCRPGRVGRRVQLHPQAARRRARADRAEDRRGGDGSRACGCHPRRAGLRRRGGGPALPSRRADGGEGLRLGRGGRGPQAASRGLARAAPPLRRKAPASPRR